MTRHSRLAGWIARRGFSSLVVFGGFGLAAVAWPTLPERLAGITLAFCAFVFARDRPSRAVAILLFFVASRSRFEFGLFALPLIWAIRYSIEERLRRHRAAIAFAPSQPKVSPQVDVEETLGRLQQEHGDRWIVEGLYGDPQVRDRAIAALANAPVELIPELIDRLLSINQEEQALAMVDRVNALSQRDREVYLVQIVVGRTCSFAVRDAALASLAASIDASSASVLISGLANADSNRADLVHLLSGLGPSIVDSLVQGLKDSNRHTRVGCIEALGRLRWTAAREAIAQCLQAREPVVRVAAAQALGQLGSHVALPELLATTQDKSWEVRAAGAAALGELRNAAAAAELKRLTADPHDEVADAARTALEAIQRAAS